MNLDTATLVSVIGPVSLLSTAVLWALLRINPHVPGVREWLLGSVMTTITFAVNLIQQLFNHDPTLYHAVINTLTLTGALLTLLGSLRFRGFPSGRVRLWLMLAVPAFFVGVYLHRYDHQARYLYHDALMALMLGATAFVLLWKTRDRFERLSHLPAALAASVLALAAVARWTSAAIATDTAVYNAAPPLNTWIFMGIILFTMGWAYGASIACYARMQRRYRSLARLDDLTGLPNRRSLMASLEQAVQTAARSGNAVGVIMLDLNDYKVINDSHGHHVGDLVLRAFAAHLREAVRKSDVVGRLGGDEFLVLVPQVREADELQQAETRLRTALDRDIEVVGRSIPVRCSIGVSVSNQDGLDPELLLVAADQRMYADKPKAQRAEADAGAITLAVAP